MSDTQTPKRNHSPQISFRAKSRTMFVDMGAKLAKPAKNTRETVPDETFINLMPWSPWGSDNQLPYQYINDIETTGVLNSIIDGKARFALCQGLVPAITHIDENGQKVIDRVVDDPEKVQFLEMNNAFDHAYAWMKDIVGLGWGVCRFMLNKEGTEITTFQRDDLSEVRFAKKDASGYISHLYYSAAWDKVRSPNDNRVFKIRLLKFNNPVADLTEKAAAGEREFAFVYRNPGWGKHYYPIAPFMPVYKWVKVAQAVPEMKIALFENSMRPMYKVIIMDEYWDNRFEQDEDWKSWDQDKLKAEKDKFYDEIDELLHGKQNVGKTIYVNGKLVDDTGKVITDIDIVEIANSAKQGELLPDSAAANSEISIGMLWNLATQGGNQKAGAYGGNEGGSNVRENTLFQTIIHEVERMAVRKFMMIIVYFNKWNTGENKGFEFVIPMTIQTTTDTGAGTKPIVTGNTQPKQKDPPQAKSKSSNKKYMLAMFDTLSETQKVEVITSLIKTAA